MIKKNKCDYKLQSEINEKIMSDPICVKQR